MSSAETQDPDLLLLQLRPLSLNPFEYLRLAWIGASVNSFRMAELGVVAQPGAFCRRPMADWRLGGEGRGRRAMPRVGDARCTCIASVHGKCDFVLRNAGPARIQPPLHLALAEA